MDFSRYEKLRTLVRANFSEQTRALVDEALEYADGKLAGLVRYDGSPQMCIRDRCWPTTKCTTDFRSAAAIRSSRSA